MSSWPPVSRMTPTLRRTARLQTRPTGLLFVVLEDIPQGLLVQQGPLV